MAVCLSYRDVYGPITTDSPEWNGGARSVEAFAANCFYGFEVPRASVGVVVGLNSPDEGQHYLEIDHGFYFTRGTVSVMENGLHVGVGPLAYPEGTRYYVVRQGTTVIYCQRPATALETDFYVDPRFPTLQLPGAILYVSLRPSYGEVFLDASLFAVGDSVLNESAGELWFVGAEDEDLASSLVGSGSAAGELSFEVVAAGGGIESFAVGELPFEAYGESYAAVSLDVSLPFTVLGSDTELNTIMIGSLPFVAFGDGSGSGVYTQLAGVSGLLPFEAVSVGHENGAGADIDLGFIAFGTGTDAVGAGAIPAGAYGELPFEAGGITSAQLDNTFSIFLRLVGEPAAGRAPQESLVSELVHVIARPPVASYTNRLHERMRVVATPRTFVTYEATLADDVLATARAYGDFRVDVAETLSVLETVTFTQIALLVDELLAAGTAETFYSAIVEILAALTVRDDQLRAGAGSSGGATGGGAITDPSGDDSDPATITLTGYFYAGTGIKVTFETTDGGVDIVYYVVPEDTDAAGAAAGLAALLDENDSVIATLSGGVITLLAQETGSTLEILSLEVFPAPGHGTAVEGVTGAAYATSVTSELTVGSEIALALQRIASFMDAITVEDSVVNRLTIVVEETATIEAADTFELTSTLLANLLDTVNVYTMFRVSDDVAQGWVMNTEGSLPISEYDNFTFNSMTFFNDQMFMAGDAGIYTHAAEDDAGADITAQISSMLLDFGTSRMKRIRSAYLGYTATNELVMKVRSVSQGQLSEHWYKATQTKTPGAPDGGYMPVGQGLKSRYWQFELTNIDGGDFEIDQVELHPLVLNRRV